MNVSKNIKSYFLRHAEKTGQDLHSDAFYNSLSPLEKILHTLSALQELQLFSCWYYEGDNSSQRGRQMLSNWSLLEDHCAGSCTYLKSFKESLEENLMLCDEQDSYDMPEKGCSHEEWKIWDDAVIGIEDCLNFICHEFVVHMSNLDPILEALLLELNARHHNGFI